MSMCGWRIRCGRGDGERQQQHVRHGKTASSPGSTLPALNTVPLVISVFRQQPAQRNKHRRQCAGPPARRASSTTLGSTAAPTSLLALNIRWIIQLGRLYGSSGHQPQDERIGTGTPTSTATATLLTGFAAEPHELPLWVYYARSRATRRPRRTLRRRRSRHRQRRRHQRWTLTGTTWHLDGTIKRPHRRRARVDRIRQRHQVVLSPPPRDCGGWSAVDDGTALDMPAPRCGTNTTYRGITPAPRWPQASWISQDTRSPQIAAPR